MSRPKGSKNKKMDDQNTPQQPDEEVKEEAVEEVEESVEDRSAYNCPSCKGEGINGNVLCAQCGGTGKI